MPTTMTRLPHDAVLPLGPADPSLQFTFPALSGESSASTIMSPLTLPRGISGYFDYSVSSRANRESSPAVTSAHRPPTSTGTYLNGSIPVVYSPLSPGVRGPAKPHSAQFLSPHLTPITQEMQYQIHQYQQQRSASMSPTRRMASTAGAAARSRSTITSLSRSAPAVVSPPAVNGMPPALPVAPAGASRSVSADAATAPSQALMIRRLIQQNGRIREAWEAERKYMEANRERVEEVYKEERALMEEERAEWESEKETLLKKIDLLQQQVAGLCGYPGPKNDVSAKGKGRHGAGGDWNMSPESMRSSASSQGSALPPQRNGGLPGSGDATLQRVPFQPISDAVSLSALQTNFVHHPTSRFSPSKQPESSPFIPMNNHGMASPPKEDATPVPIVDVQKIIPTSEGIPIKASAVQRTTFSDGPYSPPISQPTSRTPSPPADPSKFGVPNKPVKEQTLQVLAADEVDRLTMHAGHTPNHSMSVLPTVTDTTASSSGEVTPTLQQPDFTDSSAAASSSEITEPPTTRKDETSEDDGNYPDEALLDAGPEDRPLKGPLMVRNMPAHDEIFFQRLSDKLEEVSKGMEASLPAVLRDVADQEGSTDTKQSNDHDDVVAEKADSDRSSPRSREGEQTEIPLKLKRSNNFGAPFGEFR